MRTQGVTPQGTGEGITAEWVWDYFRDVDSMDPRLVARHYSEDGTFRFANEEPVRGPEAISEMLSAFYGQIRGMDHGNTGMWLGDNTAVFEAEVDFVRQDGVEVTVPAVSVIRRREERVVDFRFVMDAAPVTGG